MRFLAAATFLLVQFLLVLETPAQAPKKTKTDDKNLPGKAITFPGMPPGYRARNIEGFLVLITDDVVNNADYDQFELKPLDALALEFREVAMMMPPNLVKILRGVPIWVRWDDNAPNAPPGGSGRVVATASMQNRVSRVDVWTLLTLARARQPQRKDQSCILLHELAHVVHHQFLGPDNIEVRACYQQATDRGLYGNEYASVNAAEYFAEISCAYLDKLHYKPKDREALKELDPTGYKLMVKVWGVPERLEKWRAQLAAKTKAASSSPPPAKPTTETPKPAADPEKVAASKLQLVRSLIADGAKEKARERLRDLIRQYPKTEAAAEAEKILADLGK